MNVIKSAKSIVSIVQLEFNRNISRKDKLIEYYSSARQLVGPVIPKNKEYSKTDIEKLSRNGSTNKIHNDNDKSSEIHWMITRQENQKNIQILTNGKNNENNGKQKNIPLFASHHENHESIPFNETQLKDILLFPINRSKATNDEINDALELSKTWPSITKILTATMPESTRYILKKWKLKKINELGEDGFKQYERETLHTGKLFHSTIQNYLEKREQPNDNSPIINLWRSVNNTLIEFNPKPVLVETSIIHPYLKYKGVIDGLAIIKDAMCALEWKTSEKSKPKLSSTYDAPIQICAYLGALNVDKRHSHRSTNGYVVVAYKDGTPANSFFMSDADVKRYWQLWLKRLHEYWIRKRDGTLPEPI